MTFSDKSRYDKFLQKVTHIEGGSAMNNINRFQNAQVLSVSVENSFSEDPSMYIFLDNFHQGGKYTAQIASQHAE